MTNGWSNYAKQQMPQIAVGAVTAPSKWKIGLYTTSANPDAGSTPTEVAQTGYVRQQVIFKKSGSLLVNSNAILIPPLPSAYTFIGTAILDPAGQIWFWDDNHPTGATPSHTAVVFPPAGIVISLAS